MCVTYLFHLKQLLKTERAITLNHIAIIAAAVRQVRRPRRLSACVIGSAEHFNPFSPKFFLIVAKVSLPKRSAPYWFNPLF